ncbi:Protein of unknown function [Paracoccus seriniphilus]|uniref:DUF2484 family protein n=2 Tax=Paracoccus seriniphilus TaxID=184748 RepID=A0A239PWJ5_9RHOB|nr:DUF2484 family protein [Paracoccus seriniphilus]SNT74316.1 Protein of unknown function [Paracoccus seriniphilus]
MTTVQIMTLVLSGGWLLLGFLLPRLRGIHALRCFWALIALGVPALGLLTLSWGPMAGAGGFALGMAILLCQHGWKRQNDSVTPLD